MMRLRYLGVLCVKLAVGLTLVACGPRAAKISTSDVPEDQWSRGVWLYGQSCAGCHGENGEGSEDGPALVGEGALTITAKEGSERAARFETMVDVFQYTKEEMPPLTPGAMPDADYWAILAYVVKARGVDLKDQDLGPDNAGAIKLKEAPAAAAKPAEDAEAEDEG